MEEDVCFRCDRSKEEVRLLDAVSGNEVVKICEECVLVEDVPIIRKPSSSQLIESEKPYSIRERLRRMAGLKEKSKEISEITRKITQVNLDSLRKKKDYKQILEEKFELARKKNVPLNLIDNFNWLIMMARKKRRMDRKQLANAIQESETAIRMIENKEMPDDSSRIINKIEQYFGIKLREEGSESVFPRRKEEKGKTAAIEIKEEEKKESPAVVLKFDKETAKNITIADLQRMKKERERREAIEKAGVAASLKKEINVAELVWKGKQTTQDEAKGEKVKWEIEKSGEEIEFEE